jgi:hypothetical protein
MTESQQRSRTGLVVLLAAGCLFLGSTGGAVAGAAITGKQIKDSSLTGKDIKDQSIEASDLAQSAQHAGPQGPKGEQGVPGTPGPPGVSAFQMTSTNNGSGVSLANNSTASDLQAVCPIGYQAIGGGGASSTTSTGIDLQQSRPVQISAGSQGWQVTIVNTSGATQTVFAFASCAKFGS